MAIKHKSNQLTNRELEILFLVTEGWTNKEIAAMLGISLHTVESHLQNIYRKIGVQRRAQAAAWYAKALLEKKDCGDSN